MSPLPEDTTGSLERARSRLYEPGTIPQATRVPLTPTGNRSIPHQWEQEDVPFSKAPAFQKALPFQKKHVRVAGIFFGIAFVFFLVSLAIAGFFFYFGGNSVSVDKVAVEIQGPTTIAGGDTVPLSITVTNKNSTAIEKATIEINFPDGTRNASDVLSAYPRYTEDLGTIASGASVTRSIKVVLFGGAGEALALPYSLSYGTPASNSVFVKKSSYALAITSTPLSVSVDGPSEIVSGKPFTFALTVHSNATMSLENVVLVTTFPFGFSMTSSSLPLNNSSFLIGTMSPNSSKTITLTGTLLGQNNEQPTFHFTVGTAKTSQDQDLAVTYMTQDTTVAIASPFITATVSINGNTSTSPVITSGDYQNVTVSYTNTLSTTIENASVSVAVSGSAIDYDSIKVANGFYRSADHTIVFSRDTDPSLATLAPGASGIGTFTFSTLPAARLPVSPTITFTTSASGTRAGQTSVTEVVNTSSAKTVKVASTVILSTSASHSSGPLNNSGPIPPVANQATTYTIVWDMKNQGSAVADSMMSAILPSYVSYTEMTSGSGSFSYDKGSRVVSWNIGDLAQGASAHGAFQISITPSTSQSGRIPTLVGTASFSGYDRFAGVKISATGDQVTTETKGDPGYTSASAIVQ